MVGGRRGALTPSLEQQFRGKHASHASQAMTVVASLSLSLSLSLQSSVLPERGFQCDVGISALLTSKSMNITYSIFTSVVLHFLFSVCRPQDSTPEKESSSHFPMLNPAVRVLEWRRKFGNLHSLASTAKSHALLFFCSLECGSMHPIPMQCPILSDVLYSHARFLICCQKAVLCLKYVGMQDLVTY